MRTILLHNCRALLMDEADTLLQNAYVMVRDGKIETVSETRPEGSFEEEVDCGGQVLMPGFVNAHTHVPMTFLRGYGGGTDLQTWLNEWIFPAEAKLDDRAVAAAAGMGLAEMIASGTTCIADMYMHTDAIARCVLESGISANLSCGGIYFGAPDDFGPETCRDIQNQIELTEKWHGAGDGQILVDASIHGEYTSNPALWKWMSEYAAEHSIGMHVHVSETMTEHEQCKERWGKTPIEVLDTYGVWNTRSIAAHCVWTEPRDWEIMVQRGISCIHNPVSNLKLGSGVANIPAMQKAGVNIALGTDGVSSNNNTDMFEEMKFAACIHSGVQRNPLALLPRDVLHMATAGGAKALGRKTGKIQPGYMADLILVDFDRLNTIPCHSVRDNLVYSAAGSNVSMTMARGKIIYRNGQFLSLDMEKIRKEFEEYTMPLVFGK